MSLVVKKIVKIEIFKKHLWTYKFKEKKQKFLLTPAKINRVNIACLAYKYMEYMWWSNTVNTDISSSVDLLRKLRGKLLHP